MTTKKHNVSIRLQKAFSITLALLLIFTMFAGAASASADSIEINITTNGDAGDYGPGSTMFMLGKITNREIPMAGVPVTVSITLSPGSTILYQGAPTSDSGGFFSARFNLPYSIDGTQTFTITATYGAASTSVPFGTKANTQGLNYLGSTFVGYHSAADIKQTVAPATNNLAVGFSGNVNYFNRNTGSGQNPVPLPWVGRTELGPNTDNIDCIALYEDVPNRHIPISVNLIQQDDRSDVPYYHRDTQALITDDIDRNNSRDRRGFLFFTPSESLKPDTVYRVEISKDLANNSSANIGTDITVYFKTSAASSSGYGDGGSGSASSGATESAPSLDVPVTVDKDAGTATIDLDTETKDALIADAIAKAEENQANDATPTVIIDLSSVEDAAAAVFDAQAAQTFSDAEVAVTLILPDAEVTLSPQTLAELAENAETGTVPITVEAATVPMSDLQGMQAAQVKGYETVVSINVFVGGEKMDVPLTVSLPYTLKQGENPAAVRVWYMDDGGNLTNMNGVYNPATGMITFTINHQSYFVVGYDPVALWVNVFTDVRADAWYYDAVAYANFNSLFEGVGGGQFAPQSSMTRAMFAQVLWNIEGSGDEEATFAHEGGAPQGRGLFTDVLAEAWYYAAVQWASEKGIVEGHDGRFDPDRPITRQEMALMLYRYAEFKGFEIPANRSVPAFSDNNRIGDWANEAVRALAGAGVLSGSNDMFNPRNNATRAEVAQMFKNFMRLVAQ